MYCHMIQNSPESKPQDAMFNLLGFEFNEMYLTSYQTAPMGFQVFYQMTELFQKFPQ